MSRGVGSPAVAGYTSFVTMSRAEARQFLDRFLADMPAGLDRLAGLSATTGGPTAAELDGSPESLDALWSWAAPRFGWRDGYEPPGRGQLPPSFHPHDLEDPGGLPSWFHHPSGVGLETFATDTLWLIDGLGRYLGQAVIEHVPGARWALGATRPKGNMLANQPVLAGLGYEVSPLLTCTVKAAELLTPWQAEPPTLRATFEEWRARAAGGAG